jgi:glycerophosphoryl diester phosphodiesterase
MKTDSDQGLIDLRDPATLRTRWPLLVAHRGGVIAANAPENSLAAIHLAAHHGYDMVELDVRRAADGVPVLFHGLMGGNLLVDCGVQSIVEDLTGDQLAAIRYRASTECIATLADALALCASLGLGVMLDLKAGDPSPAFLQRIAGLLSEHNLGSATVTITRHPLVKEHLADQVMLPIAEEDARRVQRGDPISLHGQFWFGWAVALPNTAVKALHRAGALVIASINSFHYPLHARHTLARQDTRRLLAAKADGFQIDSEFEEFFP